MDITAVSDLHGFNPQLPGGDLLIVAGDLTARNEFPQYFEFFRWIAKAKYRKKIVVAGNHDCLIENERWLTESMADFEYLCDSGTEFEGFKIWGSPWTAYFDGMNPHCMAFVINAGCDTDKWLAEKWAMIPDDTDILVTHSPPFGILDRNVEGKHCGSLKLTVRLAELEPRLHVFGHIHEAYGEKGVNILPHRMAPFMEICKTKSVNASHVNEHYKPVNPPIRIKL